VELFQGIRPIRHEPAGFYKLPIVEDRWQPAFFRKVHNASVVRREQGIPRHEQRANALRGQGGEGLREVLGLLHRVEVELDLQ
jgi:hypothetical protein